MVHITIGERLKYSLEVRGISQKEFSKMIGVSDATVSKLIHGHRVFDAEIIVLICRTLGISSDWLLGMV